MTIEISEPKNIANGFDRVSGDFGEYENLWECSMEIDNTEHPKESLDGAKYIVLEIYQNSPKKYSWGIYLSAYGDNTDLDSPYFNGSMSGVCTNYDDALESVLKAYENNKDAIKSLVA